MRKMLLAFVAALGAATLAPATAQAAGAIATADVNLRAGPSTAYPVVDVVPAGYDVEIFGCLPDRDWCDVAVDGYRGWMSSHYIATLDDRRRTGTRVVEVVRAPTITFSVGGYWDRHYRDRPFYRDRGRFDRDYGRFDRDYDRPRRGWDERLEARRERWEDDWDGRDVHDRAHSDIRRAAERQMRDIEDRAFDAFRPRRSDYYRY